MLLNSRAATNYSEYKTQYAGTSRERNHFTSVCGFFELCGVLARGIFQAQSLVLERAEARSNVL